MTWNLLSQQIIIILPLRGLASDGVAQPVRRKSRKGGEQHDGRRLPAVEAGLMGLAAKLGHLGLYLLLIAVVGLGFWMHWAAAGQVSFFGLFAIPSPFLINRSIAHALLPFHFWAATVLIIVAAGHALMALFHHYVLRDGTLKRMLPPRHSRRAARRRAGSGLVKHSVPLLR